MTNLLEIGLSLVVLLSFLLIGGGGYLALRHPAERRRGVLMVVAGLVILGNVYLLARPSGASVM